MKTSFPNSEFEGPPMSSNTKPLGHQTLDPTRRDTILTLVEMLLQQNSNIIPGDPQPPSLEENKDTPSVDEYIQAVGADAFHKLQRRINNLDRELRTFANAARQLGSSVAILSSTFHLRERLAQLLFLYRENAADLFPKKIDHNARETLESPATSRRRRMFRRIKGKAELHIPRPTVTENLDPETFPQQFEFLGKEVTTFLKCLNEFPEFTDEAVNSSILSFESDLKYWASCLKEYEGQFRYPAVRRYIHDLSQEMGEHIDALTSSLSMFTEVGVPTIRFAQKHGANNLLNLSTVATFFSAVTATTMQFSYNLDQNMIADTVNCFWFASLVFSIAAAVNSLLGLTWKQAMYRSPGHRVPWWVLIWIKRSPLVFLVLSVACFSIGFCCFAYASHQAFVTSTITTVLTAFTSFGLAAVSAWFASEKWAFSRHRGQKWLSDVLIEAKDRFWLYSGITCAQRGILAAGRRLKTTYKATLHNIGILPTSTCRSSGTDDDLEAHRLPIRPQMYDPTQRRTSDTIAVVSEPSTPTSALVPPTPLNSPVDQTFSCNFAATPNTDSATTASKQLWKQAFRNVKMRNTLAPSNPLLAAVPVVNPPIRQRTTSSSLNDFSILDNKKRTSTSESVPFSRPRISAFIPKLMELEVTHDLAAHSALVRHMQFSPDGRFLATSSWDKTSVIFRVGHPFTYHRTLAHTQGFVGQVEWSPSGKILLTKMGRGIKVWSTENGVCRKTIDRNTSIETITWFPTNDAFLSIEESTATKLDLNGNVLDEYDFGNVKLQDVAITPDSQRLVGVGPLLRSPTGLHPSKSRAEKRIIVYNVETKQIENQTPVLNDVRDITLAQTIRNGLVALISYEHMAAPQLWKLELVKDRDDHTVITARLSLRHTYLPKMAVDFAGPSYFGGRNNELVLCAGKSGDIHIWDQESGALLHSIRAQAHGGDLTCIAWNNAADDPFMFAAGSHDGGVKVWTRPDLLNSTSIHDCPRTSSPEQMDSGKNFQ